MSQILVIAGFTIIILSSCVYQETLSTRVFKMHRRRYAADAGYIQWLLYLIYSLIILYLTSSAALDLLDSMS